MAAHGRRALNDLSDPFPLAPYGGRRPPCPDWFEQAVDQPFSVVPLRHDGAALELLCWGEAGWPGILLLHGNRAHARWWSPIAGLLSDRFRVAALSWSGMGGSAWRECYSLSAFADEAAAAAEAAGLFAGGAPLVVGHSFGGGPAMIAAERHGARLAGVVVLDTQVSEDPAKLAISFPNQNRSYASMEEALRRFRLVPPQDCLNHFYVDWIARQGLRAVRPGQPDVTWQFDPGLWDKLDWYDRWSAIGRARCPLVFLDGGASQYRAADNRRALRAHAPAGTRFDILAGAGHHMMLDRPIELAEAIGRYADDLQSL